jgi:hypothetical protein
MCREPIPEHDHHLQANIKNGTMSRRKVCFGCKAEAKMISNKNMRKAPWRHQNQEAPTQMRHHCGHIDSI